MSFSTHGVVDVWCGGCLCGQYGVTDKYSPALFEMKPKLVLLLYALVSLINVRSEPSLGCPMDRLSWFVSRNVANPIAFCGTCVTVGGGFALILISATNPRCSGINVRKQLLSGHSALILAVPHQLIVRLIVLYSAYTWLYTPLLYWLLHQLIVRLIVQLKRQKGL